jgi:ABC-type sugar transport system permease subunit
MKKELEFTKEEEQEFQELTKLNPKGFSQKLSVRFDAIANTIGMFFGLLMYSVIGPLLFPQYLNQELYISNIYQLIALPLLGVATGLSTAIILRFLFRILLEIRASFGLQNKVLSLVQDELNLAKEERQEIADLIKYVHEKLENGGTNNGK